MCVGGLIQQTLLVCGCGGILFCGNTHEEQRVCVLGGGGLFQQTACVGGGGGGGGGDSCLWAGAHMLTYSKAWLNELVKSGEITEKCN